MSERIDNFCKSLNEKLNNVEGRMNALKTRVNSAPKEAQDALRRHLDAAHQKLEGQKKAIEQARTNAGNWVAQKKSEGAAAIEQWKADREAKKLAHRADEAESYAAAEIEIAAATIDEAEQAVLEAIVARMDADSVAAASAGR
jgi:membrane protein involved in colicin uptake